jgi:hypothetical protein
VDFKLRAKLHEKTGGGDRESQKTVVISGLRTRFRFGFAKINAVSVRFGLLSQRYFGVGKIE